MRRQGCAAKRRRLQELVGISGLSDSGLASIIQNLQRDAIEVPVHRRDCHQAALKSVDGLQRTLSLPLVNGGSWRWHFLSPQSVLKHMLEGSPAVADAYRQVLALRPNTQQAPWKNDMVFRRAHSWQRFTTRQPEKRRWQCTYRLQSSGHRCSAKASSG